MLPFDTVRAVIDTHEADACVLLEATTRTRMVCCPAARLALVHTAVLSRDGRFRSPVVRGPRSALRPPRPWFGPRIPVQDTVPRPAATVNGAVAVAPPVFDHCSGALPYQVPA